MLQCYKRIENIQPLGLNLALVNISEKEEATSVQNTSKKMLTKSSVPIELIFLLNSEAVMYYFSVFLQSHSWSQHGAVVS